MNNVEDQLYALIQKHQDLGEMGLLFKSLGQEDEYYRCFEEANEVWKQFMELYYA